MNHKFSTIPIILLLLVLGIIFQPASTSQAESPPTNAELWQQAVNEGGCVAGFTTCIAITLSDEATGGGMNATCTYASGGGNPQGASNCNLRRAIREASLRPTSDRPILIGFDLDTTAVDNYDAVLDTWTLIIDDDLPALSRENTLDENGDVTIDGTYSVNGGRTGAPAIIVNNRGTGGVGSYSLEVESTGNTIANISWKGGGSIILKDDNNTVENNWVNLADDGQTIFLRDPIIDPADLAGTGGIVGTGFSNGNTITGNVVAGSKGRAINISGDDNLVMNNYIGTRADGTVPTVPPSLLCFDSHTYDPANWYGGWGIQLSGSNNQILNNTIAGLNSTQSPTETPPMAIEIFGGDHTVQDNIIGVDSAGSEVGVCGIGIKASDGPFNIWDNIIVDSRKGFQEPLSNTAIYLAVDGFDDGGVSVRGNIIRNDVADINMGNDFKTIEFTGLSDDDLRLFDPAQILTASDTTVTGGDSPGFPCPNCIIDLYLDDYYDTEEFKTYLGFANADSSGNFTFNLAQPIPDGMGIRTTSTTTTDNTIGSFDAGTTTVASKLYGVFSFPIVPGT